MSDLIDREAVRLAKVPYDELLSEYERGWNDACEAITENAPAASPWHRVEEPPQSGQECFTAYRSILRSDPEWLYDICYYTDDLARDCPLMDGAEHRPGWHRYESEYGDVECHPKYWMPIEPPKEDA